MSELDLVAPGAAALQPTIVASRKMNFADLFITGESSFSCGAKYKIGD
jgi:hypothetical protein